MTSPTNRSSKYNSTEALQPKLPMNFHAEQMLLGAVLINSAAIEQINDFLKPEHFYDVLHQKIFHSIQVLINKQLIATPITIRSMLEKDELYKNSNGNEYLVKLTTLAMTIINPYDYGKIVYELALKRSLISIGEQIVNDSYNSTLEQTVAEQLEKAEVSLYSLVSDGVQDKGFTPLASSVEDSLETIDKAIKNTEHITGISTGLIDIDNKLSGFQNSDLVIIAGRPSMGKTAFAINFALNACKYLLTKSKNNNDAQPQSVGFFSLEMSAEQLANRLLSIITQIESSSLRNGKINEEKYSALREASNSLMEMPFFIDDTPALSISAIRTRARRLKRQKNLGILFIDYLQLLHSNNNFNNRVLEVSEITQGLKAIAKELNIPVIALSQLSRAVEQRQDKRPLLSDLRESGSIEQDADIVMFLYRAEYYLKREEPSALSEEHNKWLKQISNEQNKAEIIIAKHRNGSVGKINLYYDDRYSTVKNFEERMK